MTESATLIVSKSEFARLCDVDRSRVSHWIAERKLTGRSIVGAGRSAKIDVAVAQAELRNSLDCSQRLGNGARTRLGQAIPKKGMAPSLTPAVACVADYDDPFDKGAAMMGLMLAYSVGVSATNMALAAGAPMKVAFAMRNLVSLAFVQNLEDALRTLGIDPEPMRYDPAAFDDIDWRARAEELGQPYDPAAWERHSRAMNAQMENAA